MRTLVLMRGLPGSGKSTFIKDKGLENYTLSSDNIRLMFNSPIVNKDGNLEINQEKNKQVFSLLYSLLESRMKEGEFTIVDATHILESSFRKYIDLAAKYRYSIYCVDFTNVSLEELKKRNKEREEFRQLPEAALDKKYEQLKLTKLPKQIQEIKPEEFNTIFLQPDDLSAYEKIHHIGDIHGCLNTLKEYISKNGNLNENEYYIFCGDYIDRGPNSVGVLEFLYEIMNKNNVRFVHGNHEKWLKKWLNNEPAQSLEFEQNTKVQFNRRGLSKKKMKDFYNHLEECVYYTYHGKTIIVTHGGLSSFTNLSLISSRQMMRGSGRYSEYDSVVEAFMNKMPKNFYQVHGHRNVDKLPIKVQTKSGQFTRCFNLEGGVEEGGHLRAMQLSADSFKCVKIREENRENN